MGSSLLLESSWGRKKTLVVCITIWCGCGRGVWERGVGEGCGRGVWEKGVGEGCGRGVYERGV
jgi:hypothetical protein